VNKQDLPWASLIWHAHYANDKIPQSTNACGSFWWKDCLALLPTFLTLFKCKAGNGSTIRLWHDSWNDNTLKEEMPHLHSFALNQDITLRKSVSTFQEDSIIDMFYRPLSMVAAAQCDDLFHILNSRSSIQQSDIWGLEGCRNGFSSRKVYALLTPYEIAPALVLWTWQACVMAKHKFFFWVLLQDRLNTRDLPTRKNFFVESQLYVLCDDHSHEEFIHLFFSCDYSQQFWCKLGIEWNTEHDLMDMLTDGRHRYDFIYFKEALIVGCWTLWN
jgi:hypothetical protein